MYESCSKDVIEKRIKNAKHEVEFFQDYDYFIVNDNLEEASKQLVSIANIARIKTKLYLCNSSYFLAVL